MISKGKRKTIKTLNIILYLQRVHVFALFNCHNFNHFYYHFHKSQQILENSNQVQLIWSNGLQAQQTQISMRIDPCRQQRL